MPTATGKFLQILDNRNKPYLTYIPATLSPTVNTTTTPTISTFLQETIQITPHSTTIFTRDLTDHDDILIAILSLLLLLCIEAIVTTVLLRTVNNTISNFGFSVKHFVELVRDFRFRRIFRPRPTQQRHNAAVNLRLLAVAVFFLVSTFAVEVLVLFLSSPALRNVENDTVSLGLVQPIIPEWSQVRYHSRVSINRVCTALSFEEVQQGATSVSTCITSDVAEDKGNIFEKTSGNVDYEIVSDLHKYGAEHVLTVGSDSAKYSARAYFTLADGLERLMPERREISRKEEQVYQMHRQYAAYLYTSYLRATKDKKRISAELLTETVKFDHDQGTGDSVRIIKVSHPASPDDKFLTVPSTRFVTKFNGPSVGDETALKYAHTVLKSCIGVTVDRADMSDLIMASGRVEGQNVLVWSEDARDLNWCSLAIALFLSTTVLLVLRYFFRPVTTIDIAGRYVKQLVGADPSRAPLELADDEKSSFYIGLVSNGTDYRYGAETDDGWMRVQEDYDDKHLP